MIFRPPALKSLNSIKRIQSRMMCASFNAKPCSAVISCYSPTNDSNETDIIINVLSALVQHIPKHGVLFSGGDMNAQISKKKKRKYQVLLTQLVKQKLGISCRFFTREQANMPKY